jgi:hypothetical protein
VIFAGCDCEDPTKVKKRGGMNFFGWHWKERNLMQNILLKYSSTIFEVGTLWPVCYRAAEMPTNGKVSRVPLFLMNKINRNTMREINIIYIKIVIIEASSSAWKALVFLVKKGHGPEKILA